MECRIGFMAFPQPVVGNPAREVVNVVEADVASQPVQHARKIVERGSVQSGRVKIPLRARLPVCLFELVLNVE